MSAQAFLSISSVCPVYFTGFWFTIIEPSHSIAVFRIGSHSLRDKQYNKFFWDPRSNLGVFYRQYQHRFVSSQQCGIEFQWNRTQLDPLWCWPDPVTRWTPFTHRERKCFDTNFLVRSNSVCSIGQRLTKSIISAYWCERLRNPV